MPELPEVETIRRQLEYLVTHEITRIQLEPSKVIRGDFSQTIGSKIISIRRFGKLLIIDLSTGFSLTIHLKMTGRLTLSDLEAEKPSYTHITFNLQPKGEKQPVNLHFSDMRKFGFVSIHPTNQIMSIQFVQRLGKEPLKDLKLDDFSALLHRSTRAIKVLLLDQNKIAGIGNIYDCEALWLSSIHPERKANSLTNTEIKRLFEAIETVLQEGIDRGGASDNTYRNLFGGKGEYQNFFKVYGRTGKPCLRCTTEIVRKTLGGRGTFFCPNCQK